MAERPQILLRRHFRMPNGGQRCVVALASAARWEVYTRQGARFLRHIFIPKQRSPTDVTREFHHQCARIEADGGTEVKT